jgi:hypothetical protein
MYTLLKYSYSAYMNKSEKKFRLKKRFVKKTNCVQVLSFWWASLPMLSYQRYSIFHSTVEDFFGPSKSLDFVPGPFRILELDPFSNLAV